MRNLDKYLTNKVLDYDRLIKYGFKVKNDCYIYQTSICDNKFKVIVEFNKLNNTSKVIDAYSLDEYLLVDIDDITGNFVGIVKEEYNRILKDIFSKCTINNVFKSSQAKKVIDYVKVKYDDSLEFLWEKYDDCAILRNKKNNKWYALILKISKRKLGLDCDDVVEIIDLKYQKDQIQSLIDNKIIFPGYHMNKNSWITIILDNSLKSEKMFELIDNSYKLSI